MYMYRETQGSGEWYEQPSQYSLCKALATSPNCIYDEKRQEGDKAMDLVYFCGNSSNVGGRKEGEMGQSMSNGKLKSSLPAVHIHPGQHG